MWVTILLVPCQPHPTKKSREGAPTELGVCLASLLAAEQSWHVLEKLFKFCQHFNKPENISIAVSSQKYTCPFWNTSLIFTAAIETTFGRFAFFPCLISCSISWMIPHCRSGWWHSLIPSCHSAPLLTYPFASSTHTNHESFSPSQMLITSPSHHFCSVSLSPFSHFSQTWIQYHGSHTVSGFVPEHHPVIHKQTRK